MVREDEEQAKKREKREPAGKGGEKGRKKEHMFMQKETISLGEEMHTRVERLPQENEAARSWNVSSVAII